MPVSVASPFNNSAWLLRQKGFQSIVDCACFKLGNSGFGSGTEKNFNLELVITCLYLFLLGKPDFKINGFLLGDYFSLLFAFNFMETIKKFPNKWMPSLTAVGNGILLPKLFWATVRKNCFSDRVKFWNSRLKAQNSQKFWDH